MSEGGGERGGERGEGERGEEERGGGSGGEWRREEERGEGETHQTDRLIIFSSPYTYMYMYIQYFPGHLLIEFHLD